MEKRDSKSKSERATDTSFRIIKQADNGAKKGGKKCSK